MPDPATDPYPTNWLAQAIREFTTFVKTPVIAALLGALGGGGFAGCQGMKNAEHADDVKNTVVAAHAETAAKLDTTAAKVDVAAVKAEEAKTETAKTAAKVGSIEEAVKKK